MHGHDAGDGLLVEVARRVTGCLRPSDVAARLGGDEFAVLIEDTHGPSSAVTIAQRIIASFAMPFDFAGQELTLATSIGIALFPDAADDYTTLLAAADEAMYAAKRLGRHSYQSYERPLNRDRSSARFPRGARDELRC